MIVSVNSESHKSEFKTLLNSTIEELNHQAKKSPKKIQQLRGQKLEPYAADIMSNLAIGSSFEDSIEIIGGQRFPDIVARKFYGIEVKTTTQNHWKTTGNSVLESTRIRGVERIYMLFGKLADPIEFRCRAYEECLSKVVVTHSPRYWIDMNLQEGDTIFDKINIPYDSLRKKRNPIKPITDYYKSKLKDGQDLWWINQDVGEASNLIIQHYNDLTMPQKTRLRDTSMVFFPEIFGNNQNKFRRVATWLVTRQSIVNRNVRDIFTSGGQQSFTIKSDTYNNIPKIFINLFTNLDSIIEVLESTSSVELSEYWNQKTTEKKKTMDWINLVSENSKTIPNVNHLDIRKMLTELMFNR